MGEQVLAAVVRRDEPETLGVVEPLHFSCRHVAFLDLKLRGGSEPRFGHDEQGTEVSSLLDYPARPMEHTAALSAGSPCARRRRGRESIFPAAAKRRPRESGRPPAGTPASALPPRPTASARGSPQSY